MSTIGIESVREQEKPERIKPRLIPSPQLGEWLREMGGSLVFTTYQSARVFFLSADTDSSTIALERIIGSAMGIAVDKDKLWITNKEQAWRFSNVGARTLKLEEDAPAVAYDAVYMPRKGMFLGGCDTHDVLADINYNGKTYELLFVNTNFSCISAIDSHHNFVPVWKPPFISALSPEDRCHLNGMGSRDGKLAYATACGESDTGLGWKPLKNGGGMLIDVQTNEIITTGLSMPHSPRWHDGKVWLLNSGDGEFGYVIPEEGTFVPVIDCPGFARGLSIIGDYAVIGLSKLRENTFASGLKIKEKLENLHVAQRCGVMIVDLRTNKMVHWLTIEGITELYDVAFLAGVERPFTPGFSYPNLHRQIMNIPSVFPLEAPKRIEPEMTENEEEKKA